MKKLSETYKEKGIAFSFPIEIRDANGKCTYFEDISGFWSKSEYDSHGNLIYYDSNKSYWCKYEYDSKGNETYREYGDGYRRGVPRASMKED